MRRQPLLQSRALQRHAPPLPAPHVSISFSWSAGIGRGDSRWWACSLVQCLAVRFVWVHLECLACCVVLSSLLVCAIVQGACGHARALGVRVSGAERPPLFTPPRLQRFPVVRLHANTTANPAPVLSLHVQSARAQAAAAAAKQEAADARDQVRARCAGGATPAPLVCANAPKC